MNIEHLYYFLDVIDSKSISKSARKLFISPQGISQAINSLEKEYRLRLFERDKNGVHLTAEGENFAVLVRTFLTGYEHFQEKSLQISSQNLQPQQQNLQIYTTPLFSQNGVLSNICTAMSEKFPALSYSISEHFPLDIIQDFADYSENSIGLVNVPEHHLAKLQIPKDVCCDFILETSMVAYTYPGSPYVNKKYFTKQELSLLPISCLNEPLMEGCIYQMLKPYGEPNIVLQSSNSKLSQQICVDKRIVGFDVDFVGQVTNAHRISIPILDSLKLKIGLVYHATSCNNETALLAINFIKHYLLSNYPDLVSER